MSIFAMLEHLSFHCRQTLFSLRSITHNGGGIVRVNWRLFLLLHSTKRWYHAGDFGARIQIHLAVVPPIWVINAATSIPEYWSSTRK